MTLIFTPRDNNANGNMAEVCRCYIVVCGYHDIWRCCNSLFSPLHYSGMSVLARVYARARISDALKGLRSWRTINSVALTFSVTPRTCEDKDKADDESSRHTENPRSYLFSFLPPACHSSCRAAPPERNEKRTGNAENNRESCGNYERTRNILVLVSYRFVACERGVEESTTFRDR